MSYGPDAHNSYLAPAFLELGRKIQKQEVWHHRGPWENVSHIDSAHKYL
jgi:hypothetical protein